MRWSRPTSFSTCAMLVGRQSELASRGTRHSAQVLKQLRVGVIRRRDVVHNHIWVVLRRNELKSRTPSRIRAGYRDNPSHFERTPEEINYIGTPIDDRRHRVFAPHTANTPLGRELEGPNVAGPPRKQSTLIPQDVQRNSVLFDLAGTLFGRCRVIALAERATRKSLRCRRCGSNQIDHIPDIDPGEVMLCTRSSPTVLTCRAARKLASIWIASHFERPKSFEDEVFRQRRLHVIRAPHFISC